MPIVLDGTAGIDNDATDLSYTGTLTGGTGVVNLGSGQFYKDASGNVGIGTSSPAGAYATFGNSSAAGANRWAAVFGTNSASAGNPSSFGLTVGWNYSGGGGENNIIYGTSAGSATGLAFSSYNGTTVTERMRIDSSGNLLVGRTTQINQERFGYTTTTDVGAIFQRANDTQFYPAIFYTSNGLIGYIYSSGSSTLYSTSSDYRLKHDIQPMTGALAKVAALKPCTYKWNVDDSTGQGFIAHELAEVCPDAVVGEKDAVNEDGSIKPQGIDTSFLVATLTAAIQELKAINDAQAQTIESLTARVVALEGQP